MKTTRIEKVEVDKEFHSYTCDLCGVEMHDQHSTRTREWNKVAREEDVRIESWTYPDCDEYDEGSMYVTGLNCCIKCFNDKIKPLIENTFNVKFNVEVM